jgi:hypothetical protein
MGTVCIGFGIQNPIQTDALTRHLPLSQWQ